jgi:hypothetical protein
MVSSIQHRRSLLEPASLCNGTYTSASNSLVLSAHKALLWTLCLQCFHHMFSLQKKKHSLTTVDRTSVAKCTGKAWITFCCHGSGKWLKQHHRHWRQERRWISTGISRRSLLTPHDTRLLSQVSTIWDLHVMCCLQAPPGANSTLHTWRWHSLMMSRECSRKIVTTRLPCFISLFLSERRSNAFNHHKSCKRTGEGTYGQIYKENTNITISLQDWSFHSENGLQKNHLRS